MYEYDLYDLYDLQLTLLGSSQIICMTHSRTISSRGVGSVLHRSCIASHRVAVKNLTVDNLQIKRDFLSDVCIHFSCFSYLLFLFLAASQFFVQKSLAPHLVSCSALIIPLRSRSITSHSHELKARVALSSFAISAHTCVS